MDRHPDILCAYPDWKSINEDGSLRLKVKSKDYDFNYMVSHHTCLPSVGSMFRSSVIEKIGYRDTSYHWLGDFDYWLRVGLAGQMLHVPATLATWRNREGQASKDKSDKRAQEHIRLAKSIYSDPLFPQSLWNVRYQAWAWSYLVAASVTDSKKKMLKYCLKAVWTYPKLLISLEFYDALIQRAKYILKR
jgi:GT2 family glycosyltransferase